jgi:hypothetical protein
MVAMIVVSATIALLQIRGILILPQAIQFWMGWPLFVLIAICWVVLRFSAGTLQVGLKRMFLGHGKSFQSASTLSAPVQALIVLIALVLAAVYVYSRMKH